MVYVDTSAVVALIVNEPASAAVAAWYAGSKRELVTASWCATEFASALSLKQRKAQLEAAGATLAWGRFRRLTANDLQLLPLGFEDFHRAALMALDASTGIRAGDALHLACAERAGAKSILTLDGVMARNAQELGIKPVALPP
ncbi:MAG TPA: type II toxin-antitoxin system VapC family toxin [Rubrivivax sp.]|nr:type II toxin-antitoxin system VapC family toxin [Rubrivivax sp.]